VKLRRCTITRCWELRSHVRRTVGVRRRSADVLGFYLPYGTPSTRSPGQKPNVHRLPTPTTRLRDLSPVQREHLIRAKRCQRPVLQPFHPNQPAWVCRVWLDQCCLPGSKPGCCIGWYADFSSSLSIFDGSYLFCMVYCDQVLSIVGGQASSSVN